ncbi:hypothetical protein MABM_47370 [Mycobacteroides abscessus]|nr:hypothetical protein MABM_47370 [Mycobacteroides abscessus]
MKIEWNELRDKAYAVTKHAYAPYSKYPVGAAALVEVKSRDVVYDVVVRFFVVVVQEVSAAGVSSCSVGVSLILRDLLRTSRPR